jgi:hypothetical protein
MADKRDRQASCLALIFDWQRIRSPCTIMSMSANQGPNDVIDPAHQR